MKVFETAKFTLNYVLQEFRLFTGYLTGKRQNNIFAFGFRGHKCADMREKNVIGPISLLLFYVNVAYISPSKVYHISTVTNISGVGCGRPCCYFRLSVVVAINSGHFLFELSSVVTVENPRIACCWDFKA